MAGALAKLIATETAKVLRAAKAVDLSHNMLTVARSNLEQAGVEHAGVRFGDVTAAPFEGGVADLVILHQVLHYLDRPERVISEAARILKPGGRLLIAWVGPRPHSNGRGQRRRLVSSVI